MLRICQSDQREWEGPTMIPISDIDDGKVCRMARRGRGPVRLGIHPLPSNQRTDLTADIGPDRPTA